MMQAWACAPCCARTRRWTWRNARLSSVGFLGVRPLQKSGAASGAASGAELWVVGVLGVVFELELGETAVLRVVGRSQLTARSFVQVGGAWQV